MDAGYNTEIAVVDVLVGIVLLVVVVLTCMTLSPGQKVQPKRSTRDCAVCSALSEARY